MNPKIKKIDAEIAKINDKIALLQERSRELSHQRTEIENTDIIGLVRSVGLTPDQLAELLRSMKSAPQAPKTQEVNIHEKV